MRLEPWRARVEDLEPGDLFHVTCHVCGHQGRITAAQIVRRIKPNAATSDLCGITPVKMLNVHLTCTRCLRLKLNPDVRKVDIHIEMQKHLHDNVSVKRCPRVMECPPGTCKELVHKCFDDMD